MVGNSMKLCDIGNSYAKLYLDQNVVRLKIEELRRFKNEKVFFINVNERAKELLAGFSRWIDLAPYVVLDTKYKGLGIDRKVACLGVENGVVVDAGSAVTVDVMIDGVHQGGFIYPGKEVFKNAIKMVSPLLDQPLIVPEGEELPLDTKGAIGYGYFRPIVSLIESYKMPVVVTGGDGIEFARLLSDAIYDEFLIFRSMKNIVQRNNLC